jgi:hypothetical protein
MCKKANAQKKKRSKSYRGFTPVGEVTSAAEWVTANAQNNPLPVALKLPSNNVCLVQPIGPMMMLSEGLVPNPLLPIVQKAMEAAQGGETVTTDEVVENLTSEPEQMQAILQMANNVTVYCVLEPNVQPVPAPGVPRDPSLLYVDRVDFEDKLFVMQFAMGGTRDLEPFRQELAAAVGVAPAEQSAAAQGDGDS